MPLHVDIRVNANLISRIHIGRMEGSANADSENTYMAVIGDAPTKYDDWTARGIEFSHRYGDGAEVCVQKAIAALANEGKLTPR